MKSVNFGKTIPLKNLKKSWWQLQRPNAKFELRSLKWADFSNVFLNFLFQVKICTYLELQAQ